MYDQQNMRWNEVRLVMWEHEEDLKCTMDEWLIPVYTVDIMYKINKYAMNDKWNGVWMTRISGRVEFQSVSQLKRLEKGLEQPSSINSPLNNKTGWICFVVNIF